MLKIEEPRLNYIYECIKEAYKKYVDLDHLNIKDKSQYDLVTTIDVNIEKYLIEKLNKEYPRDKILSEETNSDTVISGNTWTIDPIDGTYNMANHLNMFGVQVSMYKDDEIYLSLIYLPCFNETYYAVKDQGSYLNDKRIRVNNRNLEHSLISFGDFPHDNLKDLETQHKLMHSLSKKVAKIRMFGAACIDFSSVASGKTDATILFTKNKWDIAPGILLCKEAGALIKDLDGDYTSESPVVIACSNEEIYRAFLASKN